MDKKDVFATIIMIIGLCLLSFLIYTSFKYSPNSDLCIYKIPNELVYNCSGRELVAFNQNIFKHQNALGMNCTLIDYTLNYNYSYWINYCDLSSPFEKQRLK